MKLMANERDHNLLTNVYFNIGSVLIVTIAARSMLMALSLFVRNGTENVSQDVLPFATRLIGFASGLVAALFGRRAEESSGNNGSPPPSPTTPTTPTTEKK
jgi:hypothetical protein